MRTMKRPSPLQRRSINKANFTVKPKTRQELLLDGFDQPKPLFLVMQTVWFNEIESGKKKEEYRDGSNFYKSRLCNIDKKTGAILSLKRYKTVILQEGYRTGARRMIVEVEKIDFKRDFTIHLGKVLERQNFNKN